VLFRSGGVVLVRSKVLSIETELKKWVKDHPNDGKIMQPEEGALILINDLRKKDLLK
jgi:hypothetical protein